MPPGGQGVKIPGAPQTLPIPWIYQKKTKSIGLFQIAQFFLTSRFSLVKRPFRSVMSLVLLSLLAACARLPEYAQPGNASQQKTLFHDPLIE
jgi:hypothetical protein